MEDEDDWGPKLRTPFMKSRTHGPSHAPKLASRCLPKLCGGDIELGNFILGMETHAGTGGYASRLLLREIHGLPVESGWYYGGTYNLQDQGRRFLPGNSSSVYIDLDHLELAMPELLSAYDHVASWHAMLRIARDAQEAANAKLEDGQKIVVLVNNSDGQGHSYGSHLDFLVSRRAFDGIFCHQLHPLLFLAAYQTSSMIFTGQGKIGSENDAPPCDYQISQRADFFEVLTSHDTTVRRPIVNCRDEALCGDFHDRDHGIIPALHMARLHVIFFDNTLCHVASLLKVGVMQIILAMIEADRLKPELLLDRPLDAVHCWSHDPTLQARAALINRKRVTAVELQLLFLEEAIPFVEGGGCEGIVPHAEKLLGLWADTLAKLKAGDFESLTGRIDWILKKAIIEQAMRKHPKLTWQSPEVKQLDHMYSSLEDGLYWTYERRGLVERVVSDAQIERFVHEPPEDTRAWTRAQLLRCATAEQVDRVDWDKVTFQLRGVDGWPTRTTVSLPNPLGHRRADTEHIFGSGSRSIEEILSALDPESDGVSPSYSIGWGYQPVAPMASVTLSQALPAPTNQTTNQKEPNHEST